MYVIVLLKIPSTSLITSMAKNVSFHYILEIYIYVRAGIQHKVQVGMCIQQRFKSVCASAKSECDQEIPQSLIADQPTAPQGRATELKQSNQLSHPCQDDCKTRKDTK